MTRIIGDSAPLREQQHAGCLSDQARRFEWRLQWEKSMLEHRQAYQRIGCCEREQGKAVAMAHTENEQTGEAAMALSCRPPDGAPGEIESRRSPKIDPSRQKATENSAFSHDCGTDCGTTTTGTVVGSTGGEGPRHLGSIPCSRVQNARASAKPFFRPQPSPGVHVYQQDGLVEVAMRSGLFHAKDGVKLIAGLQRELATRGLALARLTLNGELCWRSAPVAAHEETLSGAAGVPINKIY